MLDIITAKIGTYLHRLPVLKNTLIEDSFPISRVRVYCTTVKPVLVDTYKYQTK